MAYRLLIVEDQTGIIEVLREAVVAAFPDMMETYDCGFNQVTPELQSKRPDLVILDLFEDGTNLDAAGPAWEYIWKTHFCPVIIYSAHDASGYEPENHPFRAYERKASGSEERIVEHIRKFLHQIEGLRRLREEIDMRIADSLRAISPLVWAESTHPDERKDLLRRVTRRRLAASLDIPAHQTDTVKALEQFICPPLEPSLLTGDVIREVGDGENTPHAFRVILTPSCDLVAGERRHPVSEVLVARCVPVNDDEVIRRHKLSAGSTKLAKHLGEKLCEDRAGDLCVLAALHDLWPTMVVDLKRIELIAREGIALGRESVEALHGFYRVASMDSPFRERFAWRYVETAGRPGLPDLDREALKQEVTKIAATLIPS